MAPRRDEDLDAVVAALEGLVSRLESAPPGALDRELAAAAAASAALVDVALPAREGAAWHAQALEVLGGGGCASLTRDAAPAALGGAGGGGTAAESDDGRGGCGVAGCGGQMGASQAKKACVHGCGAGYCSVECWKAGRRRHEGACPVLQRRRALNRIGITGTGSEGELF
jgi:hypothetical protein